ncbi:predicted protein [Nematostella vectensis]|uniref:Chitin-binding type-4 domain-containing protein n=1 Tax=Nematostella vectensis TaxID=45351 RepID=A7SSA4_NEMVE|nr:uncharacterized protein LOC5504607 [Nematostella vectensis]EDO33411.1 predicted protein [Nematostella vectensis]|eukprot:XP_001625511.1 predicted protein [Nematostella vectensis]
MAVKSILALSLLCNAVLLVHGHGYMIEPAARNACYMKFPNQCVRNYNANEQFCGGRATQIANGNKCGVCGDSYSNPSPPHVYPGKYATGFITQTYTQGQIISVKIHITANHQGWFEYRIGKIGTPPITQSKLTQLLASAEGQTRFPLTGSGSSYETQTLVLPADLTCDHCVIQWWWKVGNTWGCENGKCGNGLGPQETFVNCADVKILPGNGVVPTQAPRPPTTQTPPTKAPTDPPVPPTNPPVPPTNPPAPPTNPPKPGTCKASGAWSGNANMDNWCEVNCAQRNCPASHCVCN